MSLPPPPTPPSPRAPAPRPRRGPALPWVLGGVGVALLMVLAGLAAVWWVRTDGRGPSARQPTCPRLPSAVADDAVERWAVEDPDGEDDDVTLGSLQALCGGVLVTWEYWAPDDDEREEPDHVELAAYGIDGASWWGRESDVGATVVAQGRTLLLQDRDAEVITALDAATGEERWQGDTEEVSVFGFAEHGDLVVADAESGLGTDGAVLDTTDGSLTPFPGMLVGDGVDGFYTVQQTTLVRRDLDGREQWKVDLADRLEYRGYADSLRVAESGDQVAVTVDDYEVEDDGDDDDRLLALDASTGERRWVVDDVVEVVPGPDEGFAVVRRRDGVPDRRYIVGREPPGRVETLDARGRTTHRLALRDVDSFLTPAPDPARGPGLLDLRAGRMLTPDLELLVEDHRLAGATPQGVYAADEPGQLTLLSWEDGSVLRELDVPGVGPDEDDPFAEPAEDPVSPEELVVLDGAVVAPGDGAVRLYR